MLELASHIVETKAGHFDPKKFEDRYEDALKDLLKRKQSGKPIERPERREPAKVINLMDALRRSVQTEQKSEPAQRKKKGRKRIAGQTEMLLPIEGKQAPRNAAVRPQRAPAKRTKSRRKAS